MKLKHRSAAVTISLAVVVALPYFSGVSAEAKVHKWAPPSPTPSSSLTVLGFYTVYYTGDNTSYNSLSAYGSNLNTMSTVTWNATSTGGVTGSAPSSAITLANSDGIKSYAVVTTETNGNFDPALAHDILSSSSGTQNLVSNLLAAVRNNGYTGVNVDFEGIYASDRTSFSQMIGQLATSLHNSGYKLIVSVPAETSDQPTSSWTGAFDYSTLGKSADLVQLMTYDQHGSWGSPAYGYDWNTTNSAGNKAVAWKNIPNLLSSTAATPQWDSTDQSPYFNYTASDGTSHVVWYENSQSIEAKEQLVKQYGLGGVSMWRMGLEDAAFWSAVKTGLGM